MVVATLDVLSKLSKEDLLEVALDKQNSADIQEIALQKWLVLDEHEHRERMARMRMFLRQYWEVMKGPTRKTTP